MSPLHRRLLLAFIVLFGFCARAATFKSPLLDHHAWRQADTASISRNFYRERFNILYPQVDWRGDRQAGYVETGMELSAFLVASAAKVTGFYPELGRVLASCAFVASALLVWTFVRRRYGDAGGMIGTFMYAFAFPLPLYIERTFLNEPLLICLSLASLVAVQRYLPDGRRSALAVACVAVALLGMTKVTYLVVLAPIAGLFVEQRAGRVWRSWALGLIGVAAIVPAGMWYSHAHRLFLETGLSFGLFDKAFDAELVFSWAFAFKIGRRLFSDVLGPVGFAASLVGFAACVRARRWCELFGAAAFVVYLLAAAVGNYAHDYYQLTIAPIAPALVAAGLLAIGGTVVRRTGRMDRRDLALASLLLVAVFSTFVRLSSFHSWFYYSPPDVTFCEAARALGQPSDRVLFMLNEADPKYLFCIDRKGWVVNADGSVEHVRTAWERGAAYAFVLEPVVPDPVRAFLRDHAAPVDLPGPLQVYRFIRP